MRQLLVLIFLLFLVNPVLPQSGSTQVLYAFDIDGTTQENVRVDTVWVSVDSNATGIWKFSFRGSSANRSFWYGGEVSAIGWADTSVTEPVGARDSLTVNAFTLLYDPVDDAYERAVSATAAVDSINIADALNWGDGHADTQYTFFNGLNFARCDGVQIEVTNVDAPFKMRIELRVARQEP